MKIKHLLLFSTSLLVICNCIPAKGVKPSSSVEVTNQINETIYKIVKIDSVENVYLIYAKFNDTIYKIASQKLITPDCHRMKLGESYNLDITSVFDKNSYDALDKYGVFINNTLIKLQKDSTIIWDIFLAKNLKGLCYTASSYDTTKMLKE